jgi:hypothetical protein
VVEAQAEQDGPGAEGGGGAQVGEGQLSAADDETTCQQVKVRRGAAGPSEGTAPGAAAAAAHLKAARLAGVEGRSHCSGVKAAKARRMLERMSEGGSLETLMQFCSTDSGMILA